MTVALVLALLFVAAWGVATGGRRTLNTGETEEQFKTKRLERRLSLGCASVAVAWFFSLGFLNCVLIRLPSRWFGDSPDEK